MNQSEVKHHMFENVIELNSYCWFLFEFILLCRLFNSSSIYWYIQFESL